MPEDEARKPEAAPLFADAVAIMARLRGPGGCPWDREQTPDTIRKYTLEETYEVLDAIERQDWPNLAEELGDLLLQVLFYAEMANEAGHFTLADVLSNLNRKLVRRHPHVFGAAAAAAAGNDAAALPPVAGSSDQVVLNWNAIKQLEKKAQAKHSGYLDGVLRGQSSLSEASKLGSSAARAGFDWPDVFGLLAKVREETAEVEAELRGELLAHSQQQERVREEVGDLLFTVANLARHLKIDAEMALRDANAKFRRRFEAMEQASDRLLEEYSAAELEQAWAAAKTAESRQA
jgi:MazG family protein